MSDAPPHIGRRAAGLQSLSLAEDRALRVPAGHVVRTGYVDVFKVRLANRSRMAVGDVDAAYRKRLQCGADQPFPCPNGYWDGDTFVIQDGRHEWLAAVALGSDRILVAWVEAAPSERVAGDEDASAMDVVELVRAAVRDGGRRSCLQ